MSKEEVEDLVHSNLKDRYKRLSDKCQKYTNNEVDLEKARTMEEVNKILKSDLDLDNEIESIKADIPEYQMGMVISSLNRIADSMESIDETLQNIDSSLNKNGDD